MSVIATRFRISMLCTWLASICLSVSRRKSSSDIPSWRIEQLDELLVGVDAVLFLQVVEEIPELIVGKLVPELLAALDEQQLLHEVGNHPGRHLGEKLEQLRVRGRLDAARANRRDLAILQVGLRDDSRRSP